MRFDTPTFWLFFAIAWGLWRCLPFQAAKRVTLLSSLAFYGWWSPWYLGLIAFSALVDYGVGHRLHAAQGQRQRALWLYLSLTTNLGLLAGFKYTPFALENLAALGIDIAWDVSNWVIPVGISFYTFQTLSYTIDIYRGRLRPAASFWDFFLYVAFFPQLVAGPIVRASELLPQFRARRPLRWVTIQMGLYLCIWGTFMKVVLADNLAPMVERVFNQAALPNLSAIEVWLGVTYFTFQLFADFAGYSAIAIGVAYLMGLRFPVNFNFPFLARGPLEFWRRWHMTLSHWLRDYLYISMGGSRKGVFRTYLALWLTMVLAGLWHGSSWNYILFGVLQGLGMCIERMLRGPGVHTDRDGSPRGTWDLIRRLLEIALAFLFLEFTFVFMHASTLEMSITMLERLFLSPFEEGLGLADLGQARHLLLCLPIVLIHVGQLLREWYGKRPTPHLRAATAGVMLFLLLIVARDRGDAFFYFQF